MRGEAGRMRSSRQLSMLRGQFARRMAGRAGAGEREGCAALGSAIS